MMICYIAVQGNDLRTGERSRARCRLLQCLEEFS